MDTAPVPVEECNEPLVDLSGYDFVLSPEYFKQEISGESRMFLRKGVADKLAEIQKNFAGKYRFKIWDAYRTNEVQKKLFAQFSDQLTQEYPEWSTEELIEYATRYVNRDSENAKVQRHITGGVVDLTLVDAEGNEVPMGTQFDHFGEEAGSFYFEENALNETVRTNRKVLRDAMEAAGFFVYPYEWWHYEYGTESWALAYQKPAAIYGPTQTP